MGHTMKAGPQIMEEFGEVAMMRDGFGDLEKNAGPSRRPIVGDRG